VVERLLARGDEAVVLDNFDDHYDPAVKRATAATLVAKGAILVEGDVREPGDCARALDGVDKVVHLAARPGVRASVEDPRRTLDTNVMGTLTLLDAMREGGQRGLVFASSSSVYGGDATPPFREDMPASTPLSPYAASKRAGEHLCASYTKLFRFGVIALRFFTVYGPRGRPDMSIGKFSKLALEGKKLPLYGDGSVIRDFTYVDDIVTGILAALDRVGEASGFQVSNIGGGTTATMMELIALIEEAVGAPVEVEIQPAAPGDMPLTHADLTRARELLGFSSTVSLRDGVQRTVAWLKSQN
jgi:UDP-glucuronate 4-epimerase